MKTLRSRLARWRMPEAVIAAALLFVLAIVTEPVWGVFLPAPPGGPDGRR